jgi:hypothetical protein
MNEANIAWLSNKFIGAVQSDAVTEQAPLVRPESHVKYGAGHSVHFAQPFGPFHLIAEFQDWQSDRHTVIPSSGDPDPPPGKPEETRESRRRAAMALILFTLAESSKRSGD